MPEQRPVPGHAEVDQQTIRSAQRVPPSGAKPPTGAKPLARFLGEFIGHIARAIRHDPTGGPERHTVRRDVVEERRGVVVLRRTTIEEIEIREGPGAQGSPGSRP